MTSSCSDPPVPLCGSLLRAGALAALRLRRIGRLRGGDIALEPVDVAVGLDRARLALSYVRVQVADKLVQTQS